MPIAATIGAVGALGSAAIGAYSSSQASKAQAEQQANALATQKGMFDTAQKSLNPFITAGTNILPTLQGEITGGSGNTYADYLKTLLTPGQSASALADMPGFKFQQQYGEMAATNALAARGLGGSAGPVARGIADYTTGLAGTQYFNTVNALQGAQSQRVGQLQTFANTGASAAGNLAGNAIASGYSQAQTYGNLGTAQASGILGTGNAISGGLTGSTNALALPALLQQLKSGTSGSSGGIYGNLSGPQNSATDYSGLGGWG